MNGIRQYILKHRVLCIIQVVLVILLAVVEFVYGKPLMFLSFLGLTLLSWTGIRVTRWPLYLWCGTFLAVNTYAAFQVEYLEQIAPGDYSLALSLTLVLVLLLASLLGDKRPKDRNLPPRLGN